MEINIDEEQVCEIVIQSLQEDYIHQEYQMSGRKAAKRMKKHLRAVLKYYMVPDEFKEWENQIAED
jgi:hypothetical protein